MEQLRLGPEPDEKKLAEGKAASARRQALQAEKSSAKKAAALAAAQSKAKAAAKAAAPIPDEAERKVARDARYAARRARRLIKKPGPRWSRARPTIKKRYSAEPLCHLD